MKPLLDKDKQPATFSVVPDYSLYEYHWDGPKRHHFPVWQPRQTTLYVVFDGQSRHLFSTACILVYYSNGSLGKGAAPSNNVWDIQQLGPVVHSFRGQVQHAPPNASPLPKLTVAFEVTDGRTGFTRDILVLKSSESTQELRRNSVTVLLEREFSLTSDTLSLALSFTHSTMLWTPVTLGSLEKDPVPTHPVSRIENITTRIVRILPPASSRPRITNGRLPTELLIKTFEDYEFSTSWHKDLLSFAQVCRAWSCAMDVLHSNLRFSDDELDQTKYLLDVYTLAKALSDKPILGYGFRHFTTNNFGEHWETAIRYPGNNKPSPFTEALIAILRTTKNVQDLHLGYLDPWQTDTLYTVLHELRDVQTFSIGQLATDPVFPMRHRLNEGKRFLSVVQLARCMAQWPALTSLKVHHLHPSILGIWRFALRPPMCALTQLTIRESHLGDKDLAHLFAVSLKTLERVVLEWVEGVTNAGLLAFLVSISQNVVYLTVQYVALPPFRQRGSLLTGRKERALDVVVDKMPLLQELRIGGDVASEYMLDRRSKMFGSHDISGGTRVPVVQLWLENVPRLRWFAADERWPGWCTPGRDPIP